MWLSAVAFSSRLSACDIKVCPRGLLEWKGKVTNIITRQCQVQRTCISTLLYCNIVRILRCVCIGDRRIGARKVHRLIFSSSVILELGVNTFPLINNNIYFYDHLFSSYFDSITITFSEPNDV